ncbi:MAG: twin-arginine translocase subunit TatB [Sphingomonadales bacterium]|nr:MAG: twin-arginine translocase subunit TatB [Sphingomonadales bacterium]
MFDLSLGEMGMVALVALVVVGPKELPGLLRTLASWRRQIGDVANQFRSGFDEMMREAELEELRRKAMEMPTANPYQPKPDFSDLAERPAAPEAAPLSAGDVGEPADPAPETPAEPQAAEPTAGKP